MIGVAGVVSKLYGKATPAHPIDRKSIFIIRSHTGSYIFMNHFLGGHVIRVNLISGQSLGAVKPRSTSIICIPW